MIFHIARDGQPLGTFTQEEIRDHLEANRLQVTDLVWTRGMEDWEALAQVFDVEIFDDGDEEEGMDRPELPPAMPPAVPGSGISIPVESWKSSPTLPDGPPLDAKASGWAIASLVLGCVSIAGLCFTAIPGIICGHTALEEIRTSRGTVSGKGMARTGLILGYLICVLTVIGSIGYFGYYTVEKVETRAQETDVMRDARTIMMALKVYASEHDGKYPDSLQTLVDQGMLTSERALNSSVPEWVGKPGWKYFGAGLGPADHFSKIILESRSRDIEGRGIQVTNDGDVDLVEIVDEEVK
jgi:type II secretory pathway pseudopilin PulG